MSEYFLNNSQQCCKEFDLILKSNRYINKKMIDNFFDRYEDTFNYINKNDNLISQELKNKLYKIINNGYQIIEKRNKIFIENKLVEYKIYFDEMFKEIDSNIILDEEQRTAIIMDEDYSLVIAGAGSGKTTTMAAKVKYLIEKCNVSPKKIILLAFTKKAASELDARINLDFKLNVEVLTFHKLGMQFIRKIFDKPVKIVGDATSYEIISEYVKNEIFPNKQKLLQFINVFNKYVHFEEGTLGYPDFNSHFDSYVLKKYEENKDNLEQYINERIKRRIKNNRTINGETLKSRGEVEIANFLYLNSLHYSYEKTYPFKLDEERSYSPDFTISDNGLDIYVEYYGLTTYNPNGNYTTDDIRTYNKLIEKKKILHRKYNTDLIELYSKYNNGSNYLKVLEEELIKRSIKFDKKTQEQIFYRLLYTSEEAEYFKFINLCVSFINRFKEKGYDINDFDELINETKDEETIKQLELIKPIYKYYQRRIHSEYKIDFNDMINYAYKGMEKAKFKYKYLDYDYLIIDEYQDISTQRYNFAKKLSDLFCAKIVAVGDDWQAIFGFSGSDIDLFTKFYDLMGYAEITKITNTYRNSQELIDTAGEFVSKNEEQFTKNLTSRKHLDKPIEINYYDISNINSSVETLENIIGKIYLKNQESNILILGRYQGDIDIYLDSGEFKTGVKEQIICNKYPKAKINFMTIHKSKGLGYDEVILINALNSKYGFPSQIEDEPLLKTLDKTKTELIEYPEERRLFYVALTRTKNKVYILCPYYPLSKRSDFVREIIDNKNVLEVK